MIILFRVISFLSKGKFSLFHLCNSTDTLISDSEGYEVMKKYLIEQTKFWYC